MLVAIIGESCTGKSTLAERLKGQLDATVYSGKDYLRLAKNETIAAKLFQKKLAEAVRGENVVYVIAEKEHLPLLPGDCVRILTTADLDIILERFTARMHGNLPAPVKAMLEKKHGCFDSVVHDFHIHNSGNIDTVLLQIQEKMNG